ncbi:PREDICTED: eIF-2-alpha kinase activator GCN1-like [Ipomoea nil]|uniref:eIF-2-alpha kinase activator GCN1-like n=1 Tax=Ipomoea nil TaxID=35883 RepID=UPI000901EB2F|nr:PREDICTED: eIF-2-alpha kinase activator GCN1-like [Ipomoea nil]
MQSAIDEADPFVFFVDSVKDKGYHWLYIHSVADVLGTKDLPVVMTILISRTLGLIIGSAELREKAGLGCGGLIEVTSEQALKEFFIPITGFPWQVKSAILATLSIIIRKGGLALKPFLPQLQTTFDKCLQDNTRTVRSSAAIALGKLSALTNRIDPLVGDLLSALQQASDVGIGEAILTALKGVIKHAAKSVSSASRTLIVDALYYNPSFTLSILQKLGVATEIFNLWFHMLQQTKKSGARANSKREHEKRVCCLGLTSLLSLPADQMPAAAFEGIF